MTTISSSTSYPFAWPTRLGPSLITCPETLSIARRISRRSSSTTFRAPTYSWATPRICRVAGRSRVNPYGITSSVSPESVMSSPVSATPMSSRHSSPARATKAWCMSSDAINQRPRRSYSTLPLGMPPAMRQSMLFLSRAIGRWLPAAVRGCHKRSPVRAQRGAPKVARGGQSNDPNES
jgi:hypothetical protein